jgi:hypothetical protein
MLAKNQHCHSERSEESYILSIFKRGDPSDLRPQNVLYVKSSAKIFIKWSFIYNVLVNCNQKIEKFYSMNVNYLTKGGH